eukprot:TRINITY_DN2607_c0_g5_i1.p1 TRINITY_DN2607_c0_g5~~TRINITY_DN2607_c0_g5_i1.p1  ORF type:complete len:181 (-),score=36.55 TRINITY_DN2607_c0_g5_i1:177-719(-)
MNTGEFERVCVLEDHTGAVACVSFSPDGKKIASGSSDKSVRLWDSTTGICEHVLEGHKSVADSVFFSPDGKKIASGSDDKSVRLWDVSTGACEQILQGHMDSVLSVAFSSDGKQFASESRDKTVRVWNLDTGECETVFPEATREATFSNGMPINFNGSKAVSTCHKAGVHPNNKNSVLLT